MSIQYKNKYSSTVKMFRTPELEILQVCIFFCKPDLLCHWSSQPELLKFYFLIGVKLIYNVNLYSVSYKCLYIQ